ncbi:ATP-NAD kinase [Ramaria rubella]|nr:ATP-NAD kinase [Ramaria rubella]
MFTRMKPAVKSCFIRYISTQTSSAPRSILFVKKKQDVTVAKAFVAVIKHVQETYPTTRLLHEEDSSSHNHLDEIPAGSIEHWSPQAKDPIDLVVTLGGDGTILRVSSLFRTGPVPPVLSFSMGTLGFLLPFHIDDFRKALHGIFHGQATVLERMRLSCTFHDVNGSEIGSCSPAGWQVMNEVTLHRGRSPHLNIVDVYVDGVHLTEAFVRYAKHFHCLKNVANYFKSDGLIISTPTGSTAYSLSSGGPIVHPLVKALLLTPICPRSLSFRPLLLPGTSRLTLEINSKSRAPVEVSMDGQEPVSRIRSLSPGESIRVQVSPYPIPCIRRSPPVAEGDNGNGSLDNRSDDWVRDINTLLQFNAAFRNKGMLRHSPR